MPRNIERDEKEAMRRKEQLMEAGFRLFSQYGRRGIMNVKISSSIYPTIQCKFQAVAKKQ